MGIFDGLTTIDVVALRISVCPLSIMTSVKSIISVTNSTNNTGYYVVV